MEEEDTVSSGATGHCWILVIAYSIYCKTNTAACLNKQVTAKYVCHAKRTRKFFLKVKAESLLLPGCEAKHVF